MKTEPPPASPAGGIGIDPPLSPPAGGRGTDIESSPLPLAGGVGGGQQPQNSKGQFKPRNTARAKELRNQASPAERRLWTILSARKLGGFKFSRQMPVGPYFADFLCREARLVVELDGFSHEARQAQDRRRDAFMKAQGFRVIRFVNEEVIGNLDGVAQAISVALGDTGPPPTAPARGRGEKANASETRFGA